MNDVQLKFFLFFAVIFAPVALLVKLDLDCEDAKKHPTVKAKVPTRKEKEAKKYPPGERDTEMRNAIKNHDIAKIKSLLKGHSFINPKKKQNKAYKRFTKGLYGGWDWELFKQLLPRLLITFFWSLFVNPFYFLSAHSNFQFLKIPLKSIEYGFTAFFYFMYLLGFETGSDKLLLQELKKIIANYWSRLHFLNVLYMLYRIKTDLKAPPYLMMILASDDFTPDEKEELLALFYAKKADSGYPKYKPRAMQTYGIICTEHKAAEGIEDWLTALEDRLQKIDEEEKPRGHEWLMSIWVPRQVIRALRGAIFYSGLRFTYIALPASLDDTYKIATYQDDVSLNVDEFYAQDDQDKEKKSLDFSKMTWKIVSLFWAICLHSGFPSAYQLPNVQAKS